MFVYTALFSVGLAADTGQGLALVIGTMTYATTVFLFYGVARMAYLKKTWLLWGSAVAAIIVGYLLSGITGGWQLVTGWSAILVSSALVGRLTLAGKNQQWVYLCGLGAVILFSVAQFAPIWQELMVATKQFLAAKFETIEQDALALGYGADSMRQNIDQALATIDGLIRLLPSMTVLGVAMQFSIGYLIFARQTGKDGNGIKGLAPFAMWKVPFGVTPVLILAMFMRLFGGEAITLAADNILLFLAVYYSVTGLALIEFYLRKFKFSGLMKVLFYVMLFFAQMIGFVVAALLGFVDSFVDWRKTNQLSVAEE